MGIIEEHKLQRLELQTTMFPAQISTNTFDMVDAAPSAAVITGPTAISEGASGFVGHLLERILRPEQLIIGGFTGAEDADFFFCSKDRFHDQP